MLEGIAIDRLPDTWRTVPLGSFCDFSGGTQPPKSTFRSSPADGYIRLLQIRDFETDRYAVYVPANKRLRVIGGDDISIGRYGASVGRILTGKSGAINVAIMTTFPDEAQVSKIFLRFALGHWDFQNYLTGLGGRAAQAGFNQGEVSRFKFHLPPVSEQQKIAGVLGLVQRAMEQQERLIEKTAELKKTLLHELFTQGTRGEPQKQTDLGPVPESWEVVKLSEVCTFISGGTPSKQRSDFWEGTIPWASPKDMKRPRLRDVPDHISDEALEDGSRLAPAGSIFVVIRGMILAKDVPVALAEVPMAFNQDMKAIIPGERISSAFLLYALGAFKRNLFEKVGRSAHGTMTLMSTEISSFAIPLPDRKTQDEIATAIETVETKLSHHRRKHATLSALFRTLLHQLMTAQLRVHDLDLDGIR